MKQTLFSCIPYYIIPRLCALTCTIVLIVTVIVDELKWIWILMDNMDNTESPDFKLPDSETLSNFDGFSPSDIHDMDNIDYQL